MNRLFGANRLVTYSYCPTSKKAIPIRISNGRFAARHLQWIVRLEHYTSAIVRSELSAVLGAVMKSRNQGSSGIIVGKAVVRRRRIG